MARKLKASDVEFTIECLPEDQSIEGNAMVSGNDAEDKEVEDWIKNQLNSGNEWAWCCVKVTASIKILSKRQGYVDQDCTLEGSDYLGACSYQSKADFIEGGYFDDMKREALADLQAKIDAIAPVVCDHV